MSLQTSRDELVIPANQSVLRDRLPAAQLTSAIVAEDEPSHCGFELGEGVAGWEALRAWMADDDAKPDAASLQADCETLSAAGLGGECRFAAAVQDIPDLDDVVPVRPASQAATIDARFSGQWYDPARNGEGIVLEVLDPPDAAQRRAVIYFFTYPPAGATGRQAWMYGVGTITEDGIAFDDMRRPQRVRNAAGETVTQQTRWGRLWLSFDNCLHGRMRWEGPQGWGSAEVPLSRLTTLDGLGCNSNPGDPSITPADSGIWAANPDFAANSGFVVEQTAPDRNVMFWFDPGSVAGGQRWMIGIADQPFDPSTPLTLLRGVGPRFGMNFDPSAFRTIPGMRLSQQELGCDGNGHASLRFYDDAGHLLDPIQISLGRVTRPAGIPNCPP